MSNTSAGAASTGRPGIAVRRGDRDLRAPIPRVQSNFSCRVSVQRSKSEFAQSPLRNAEERLRTAGCLTQVHAELFSIDALSLRRDGDCACAVHAFYPVLCKAVCADGYSDRAGNMRASFAPIEAGPAQDASRAPAVTVKMASRSMPIRPKNSIPASVTNPPSLASST